ncbi:hypothetical protein [Hamadaea tsunoensis]|uniref:hypothetical protein n=1 Tax=Hamadaea tsunoensis TaxID=53368 RepID=UPI0006861B10|nr:hypothetical protein [Hamadaea tsunoensis]
MRVRTAVAGLVLILAAAGCADDPAAPAASGGDFGLPADPGAAAVAAGLPMLGQEMLAVHYHAHLDVSAHGKIITVPGGIGIDTRKNKISPLHTHDTSGIVHIESAADIPFTLGQFFTEWGHPISATAIGSARAADGEQVRVYRNGTLVTGDPAAMKFEPHDEIFVYLGGANDQPQAPTSYEFPQGT